MDKLKNSVYIGVGILVYLTLGYIFLKYALGIILPFLISFLIVVMSRPLVDKISSHTRVSKSVVSLFVIGICLVLLIYVITLATGAILEQIGNIITMVTEHLSKEDNYVTKITSFIEAMLEKFPFLKSDLTNDTSIYSVVLDMAKNAINALSAWMTRAIGEFIASMPEIIVTTIVILLSLFYFSKDYSKITSKISSFFPESIRARLPGMKRDMTSVLSNYIRSYVILAFITFAEIFSGLLILGVENAFTISVIVAVIDLLPILGTGAVLVPWALISFMVGNTRLAIGIAILFGVVYVIRQVIEPKIVSSHMDVHPLIAILAMYAGLKIAGLGGMIVAPLLAFVTKTIYDGLKKEKSIEKNNKL